MLFSVIAAAVESLLGPDAKATLIFWRARHPLPGSRAFDKANFDRDTRIDRDRLREVVGGKFPRSAADQNAVWYRLYRLVSTDTTIHEMHIDYLTFRDLAWFSVVLCSLSLANLVFAAAGRPAVFTTLAFAAMYLLFRTAAAERGHRFVNQVLVSACTSERPAGSAASKGPHR
jgi:hypothetical protein